MGCVGWWWRAGVPGTTVPRALLVTECEAQVRSELLCEASPVKTSDTFPL